MKIAFIGCVDSSFRALQKLLEMKSLDIEVVAVVTKSKSVINDDFKVLSNLCDYHNINFHY